MILPREGSTTASSSTMRLVLASASPRRGSLLKQVGFEPDDIRPTDIDESVRPGETPRQYVTRMACAKAAVGTLNSDEVLLAADTIVSVGRRILGKARDASDAARYLRLLSGRRHRVLTAVALRRACGTRCKLVVTVVKMKRLGEEDISSYIQSGEWQGKAGAYGIQGRAGRFVPWIRGSFTSVVGLPVAETADLLLSCGISPKIDT